MSRQQKIVSVTFYRSAWLVTSQEEKKKQMSMCAIFEMSCCGRKVIHGRFMGQDGAVITKPKCPFGCEITNKKDGVAIRFVEYKTENLCSPELLKRWKYKSTDLWPKYDREWRKKKEAVDQGRAPEPKEKKGKKK